MDAVHSISDPAQRFTVIVALTPRFVDSLISVLNLEKSVSDLEAGHLTSEPAISTPFDPSLEETTNVVSAGPVALEQGRWGALTCGHLIVR